MTYNTYLLASNWPLPPPARAQALATAHWGSMSFAIDVQGRSTPDRVNIRRRRIRTLVMLAVALAAGEFLILWGDQLADTPWWIHPLYPAFYVASTFRCFRTATRQQGSDKKAWICFGFGCLGMTIGGVFWAFYSVLFFESSPDSSIVDVSLEHEVTVRRNGERIQRTLFLIAQLAAEPMEVKAFYAAVHNAISDIIYARNFYVALIDEDADMLRFPYKVDETDADWPDLPLSGAGEDHGPTMYVVRTGKAILFGDDKTAYPQGLHGVTPVGWLGAPLRIDDKVIGVLAVQSYNQQASYDQQDLDLMTFVARHVASAIMHRNDQQALEQARHELEHRVEERTVELRQANDTLQSTLEKLKSAQSQLVQAEKLASLGGLVAGVAHEINTPLGVAITATTHLQQKMSRQQEDGAGSNRLWTLFWAICNAPPSWWQPTKPVVSAANSISTINWKPP